MRNRVSFVCGILIAVPIFFLTTLALITPITLSGIGYLMGLGLIAVGCLTTPWRRRRLWGIGWLGVALVVGTAVFRIFLVSQNDTVYLVTLPDERNGRLLNALIDEPDVTLFGFRLATALGLITHHETQNGLPAFINLYRDIRQTDGFTPSPFLATYLGLQSLDTFDVLVMEPAQEAETAVLFLHGFGGNFTFECWLVARAARQAGAVTVCPSARWIGDWWTVEGETAVRATLDYLHNRGIQSIVLAGLSNGGIGASELAPRLSNQLDGLIFISGVNPEAADSGLPVLLLHGLRDERIPSSLAANYVAHIGQKATYVPLPGDHFLLAKQADAVRDVITAWLIEIWGSTDNSFTNGYVPITITP